MVGKPFLLSVVIIVAKFDSLNHLALSVCCTSACFLIISQSYGYFIKFSYWVKNGQLRFVLSLFLSFGQIWGSYSYKIVLIKKECIFDFTQGCQTPAEGVPLLDKASSQEPKSEPSNKETASVSGTSTAVSKIDTSGVQLRNKSRNNNRTAHCAPYVVPRFDDVEEDSVKVCYSLIFSSLFSLCSFLLTSLCVFSKMSWSSLIILSYVTCSIWHRYHICPLFTQKRSAVILLQLLLNINWIDGF